MLLELMCEVDLLLEVFILINELPREDILSPVVNLAVNKRSHFGVAFVRDSRAARVVRHWRNYASGGGSIVPRCRCRQSMPRLISHSFFNPQPSPAQHWNLSL